MSRSLNMNLCLRAFSIAIYQKFDLYYLCLFRLFSGLQVIQFWSVNYASYFRPSLIYGQCWDWRFLVVRILRVTVSVLSYFFSWFFLVCKLCKSGLYIITYFEHGKCFIWGFLIYSLLVFSVFKYLKFTLLAIFPDLEMLKFWTVNYIYQVCKLYFYFGHVRNFGQYLYLSVFSKHWKCPTFSFS